MTQATSHTAAAPASAAPVAPQAAGSMMSTFKHARYVIGENPVTGFAFGLFLLIVVFAVLGPWVVPYDPLASNTRAHKFYQRIGFVPTHRQTFNDEDDCLVHRLTRAEWRERNPRIQGDSQ